MINKSQNIFISFTKKKGQIAVLIDPEKAQNASQLKELIEKAVFAKIDYFFVGGSTVTRAEFEWTISFLRKNCSIPLIIFPGSNHQLSNKADGLLYLSLLSGRNPDYLIGQHITSAQEVFNLGIEILPTAYILIDGGTKSSVAYVSQTTPVPKDQTGIAVKTALAGIMQGKKIVYFDAGSGAKNTVSTQIISSLREKVDPIIIVGGGIKNITEIKDFKTAGVNIIVIGNKIEEELDFLLDVKEFIDKVEER